MTIHSLTCLGYRGRGGQCFPIPGNSITGSACSEHSDPTESPTGLRRWNEFHSVTKVKKKVTFGMPSERSKWTFSYLRRIRDSIFPSSLFSELSTSSKFPHWRSQVFSFNIYNLSLRSHCFLVRWKTGVIGNSVFLNQRNSFTDSQTASKLFRWRRDLLFHISLFH